VIVKYIIQSGVGYFVGMTNNTPEMVTDPERATAFDLETAESWQHELETKGFVAELIVKVERE
jgi:hypothetical protein